MCTKTGFENRLKVGMLVTSVHGRRRQENCHEFKVSLDNRVLKPLKQKQQLVHTRSIGEWSKRIRSSSLAFDSWGFEGSLGYMRNYLKTGRKKKKENYWIILSHDPDMGFQMLRIPGGTVPLVPSSGRQVRSVPPDLGRLARSVLRAA